MRTREDIESYLMRSNLSFQSVSEGEEDDMWLVRDSAEGENIIVTLAGSLLLFRVKVMELDGISDRMGLFENLLTFNAEDMVHGAYGIADDHVVLTAGIPAENVDYNEFQGIVDDLTLALTNHYESLAAYRPGGVAA